MRTRFRSEDDDWRSDGAKITDPNTLQIIRHCLGTDGPIIVEHWFYRGSRAPDRLIFNEAKDFEEYLNLHAFAGDAIHVWNYPDACRDDNELAHGKCPDDNGLVPKCGPY
jgi:hypothetical protein